MIPATPGTIVHLELERASPAEASLPVVLWARLRPDAVLFYPYAANHNGALAAVIKGNKADQFGLMGTIAQVRIEIPEAGA